MMRVREYDSLSSTPFYLAQARLAAPYAETPAPVAREMLRLAGARPGELVVDLGCGDGSILIVAASEFGCRCVGYEIDPRLAELARERVAALGLSDRVAVVCGDLFEADLGGADVVALYLTPRVLSALRAKLEAELRRGARVVVHDYLIEGWEPRAVRELRTRGPHTHTVALYVIE